MKPVANSSNHFELLSELTLNPPSFGPVFPWNESTQPSPRVLALTSALGQEEEELETLKSLAMTNHVIVRSFGPLRQIFEARGFTKAANWTQTAMWQEQDRINNALASLEQICAALEEGGCRAIVIKSLDHWPDLGNDLDLYTDASSSAVVDVMRARFDAHVEERSWGDRLANKWNFSIPGLPELVEVHIGRLGQTGEQIALTRSPGVLAT
jgi:hypothetical protein